MAVKFITLKWGTKYGPEYVNRLYHSIKKTYSDSFEFHCFTDDYTNIDKGCQLHSLDNLPHFGVDVFTLAKIDLFNELPFEGPYVLLDLDVLILRDLKPYFDEYQFKEPRIGYCYWQDPDRIYHSYQRGDCYYNSSFVTWTGDQLKHVYDTYTDNQMAVVWKFKSFDKFMFYFCDLTFHPKGVMYAYNFGTEYPDDEPGILHEDYYLTIFNTSGINEGKELHEADGWAKDRWESHR
jgi:hypothetical protein